MTVSETPARQVALTAGFNTIEYGEAAAEVRLNNLGAGRWLSLRATAGNLLGEQLSGKTIFRSGLPRDVTGDPQGFLRPTYQASVTMTQPWIAGPRTSAAITAFAGRRSVANVVIDEDAGASVGVVREFGIRTERANAVLIVVENGDFHRFAFVRGESIGSRSSVTIRSRNQRLPGS